MQSRELEILVHVNAPSRVTSDATYRQLAQAYLAFKPSTCTSLPGAEELGEKDVGSSHASQVRAQPPSSRQEHAGTSQQPIVLDSQDLSFRSAFDNRCSPRLPTCALQAVDDKDIIPSSLPGDGGSQNSWCAPPSQISDSYPMPNLAVYVSPTRVLRRIVAQSSSRAQRRGSSPEHFDIPSSVPDPASQEQQQAGYVDAAKVVPVTPLVTAATKRRNDADDNEDESAWDITHISGSDLDAQHPQGTSSSRESEPPPIKKAKTTGTISTAPVAAQEVKGLIRSSSDTTGTTRHRSAPTPSSNQLDTLEIRSPSPPIGIDTIEPAGLVSNKLAKLAVDLSSRYRPETTRPIEPLERGYWVIDCTAWTAEKRTETWAFLASYLRSGLAGWGVWCRRDDAPGHAWVRLYCWGHIAKHTYLLLYLASGRHLKLTGAEWRDADGEVVLRVPPHEKQA